MDEETLLFFENDLEIPAKELLADFELKVEKWCRALNKLQSTIILNKSNVILIEDYKIANNKQNLLKNYKKFEEEFLIWHFSQRKSDTLVGEIFQKVFDKSPTTDDRFIQLLQIYRKDRQALKTIKSFQLLQHRGWKQYAIMSKNVFQNGSFEEFATPENVTQVLNNTYLATPPKTADLFEYDENATKERIFLSMFCQDIKQTDNSVFLFFRQPKECVFVTKRSPAVGDHRYLQTSIILKFHKKLENVAIYSSSQVGIKLAEKIAEAFLNTPVKCVLSTNFVAEDVFKSFIHKLVYQQPNGQNPYAIKTKLQTIEGLILDISHPPRGSCIGDFIQKYGLEDLKALKEAEIMFESQRVNLFFEKEQDRFLVYFNSRSLAFDSRTRFVQWGSQFGITLQQK
jgi:hypothetical protein